LNNGADRGLAYRVARRLLPPHRRHWADAMFNETCHLPAGAAWQFRMGCVLASLHQRIIHELELTRMSRKILKAVVGAALLLVVGTVGIYLVSKPYQRERIRIELRQALNLGDHAARQPPR
jgi:hypothetical protein